MNNAGWATFGEIEWISMETYRKIAEVNVFGLIRGTQGLIAESQLTALYLLQLIFKVAFLSWLFWSIILLMTKIWDGQIKQDLCRKASAE